MHFSLFCGELAHDWIRKFVSLLMFSWSSKDGEYFHSCTAIYKDFQLFRIFPIIFKSSSRHGETQLSFISVFFSSLLLLFMIFLSLINLVCKAFVFSENPTLILAWNISTNCEIISLILVFLYQIAKRRNILIFLKQILKADNEVRQYKNFLNFSFVF